MNAFSSVRRSSLTAAMIFATVATCAMSAHGEEVQVAVAANFAGPFKKIAADFALDTGHTTVVVTGSTGKFYTQIKAGAPFEVLLAADDDTPKKLVAEGLAVAGQQFTYAKGTLVLWSRQAGLVDEHGAVLSKGRFEHLALANPKLAPYGAAAIEALKSMKIHEAVQPRIVQGESIGQAFQFVSTGNAELGFVALSQVAPPDRPFEGSMWVVPAEYYSPILQDAVLLSPGRSNPAAAALLAYMRGDKAKAVIRSFGYGL